MYFNDRQQQLHGKEAFDDKVNRVMKQLEILKRVFKQREMDVQESEENKEDKEQTSQNTLKDIEALQDRANRILNPLESEDALKGVASIKPLTDALQKLSVSSSDTPESSNITYELMYNKDCNNIMVAAKISELKKRLNILQKCLGTWENKKSEKYKDLSHMLEVTQDQIKLMKENEIKIIFKKTRSLFNSIFKVHEAKEQDDIKFDNELMHELFEVVAEDKEESDKVENDIQRLESLSHIHDESAETFNKVKELQESQASLMEGLGDDKKSLEYIQESLRENIQTIKDNMENIKGRISKLKN